LQRGHLLPSNLDYDFLVISCNIKMKIVEARELKIIFWSFPIIEK